SAGGHPGVAGRGPRQFEPEEDRADRDLVPVFEGGLVDRIAVDPHAGPTPEIAEHQPVGDLGDAAVPPGDPRMRELGVALEMATDQQDGPFQGDGPDQAGGQGDESGGHGSSDSGVWASASASAAAASLSSAGIWTMTWIRQ